MELARQVVSLDLAKRLKELGVKQDSVFSWYKFKDDEAELLRGYGGGKTERSEMWSAFTVAELGEMLPPRLDTPHREYILQFDRFNNLWLYYYESVSRADDIKRDDESFESEADARAKMLIHLLEEKLIKN